MVILINMLLLCVDIIIMEDDRNGFYVDERYHFKTESTYRNGLQHGISIRYRMSTIGWVLSEIHWYSNGEIQGISISDLQFDCAIKRHQSIDHRIVTHLDCYRRRKIDREELDRIQRESIKQEQESIKQGQERINFSQERIDKLFAEYESLKKK